MKNYFVKYKMSNVTDATVYGIEMESDSITSAEKQAKDTLGQTAIIVSVTEDAPLETSLWFKIITGIAGVALVVATISIIKSMIKGS